MMDQSQEPSLQKSSSTQSSSEDNLASAEDSFAPRQDLSSELKASESTIILPTTTIKDDAKPLQANSPFDGTQNEQVRATAITEADEMSAREMPGANIPLENATTPRFCTTAITKVEAENLTPGHVLELESATGEPIEGVMIGITWKVTNNEGGNDSFSMTPFAEVCLGQGAEDPLTGAHGPPVGGGDGSRVARRYQDRATDLAGAATDAKGLELAHGETSDEKSGSETKGK